MLVFIACQMFLELFRMEERDVASVQGWPVWLLRGCSPPSIAQGCGDPQLLCSPVYCPGLCGPPCVLPAALSPPGNREVCGAVCGADPSDWGAFRSSWYLSQLLNCSFESAPLSLLMKLCPSALSVLTVCPLFRPHPVCLGLLPQPLT